MRFQKHAVTIAQPPVPPCHFLDSCEHRGQHGVGTKFPVDRL
jgi:hypothetical protein